VLVGGADDTERAGTEAAAKALILAFLEKLEDKIYICILQAVSNISSISKESIKRR